MNYRIPYRNRYLDFLHLELVPGLITVMFPNDVDPDIPTEKPWFQQDSFLPHFGINAREYFDDILAGRWIGPPGTIEWPPRYPHLTPLDYFLWGYLKDKVYQNRPDTIKDLKNRSRVESNNVPAEVIQNSIDRFYHRLGANKEQGEWHFQHSR